MSNRSREGVIDCSGDVPLTQQSPKDECDINIIVERAKRGADLSSLTRSNAPMYGDFTRLPYYRSSLLMINQANAMFMALDASVRERFANDPAKLLDFLAVESNREEALKLGLLRPKEPPKVDETLNTLKSIDSSLKSHSGAKKTKPTGEGE